MRKGVTIQNSHGWTLEQVKAYEKTVKKASMAKRVSVIQLMIEGHYPMEAAQLLNVHRDTVSTYVKKFNQGGMEALLHRGSSPGKPPLLSPCQEAEVKRMIEHSTPAEEGYGCDTCWDTRVLKEVLEENYLIKMTRMGIGKILKRWASAIHARRIHGNRKPFKKSWI